MSVHRTLAQRAAFPAAFRGGRLRTSIIALLAAAFLLVGSPAIAASGFALQYDAIGATGGYVGGSILGITVGQPAMGVATAADGGIIETAGFWHPRNNPSAVSVSEPGTALTFALMPIAPNPAFRAATIRYVVPASASGSNVSVRVFDMAGRLVRTVASGPQTAGTHTITWDGHNSAGAQLGAGVFFVELAAGSNRSVRRVALLR